MGQSNTAPRKINRVEGVLGQLMRSMGPGNCEQWVNPSDIGVDYGLSFIGTVTGIAAAPKFQCSGLIGFGDDYFKDYWAYVVWDAGGAGADPQGQMLECTGYSSATGDFTVAAFAPNVIAVGDKVLLLHRSIAALINTTYGLAALAASWTAALATALGNYTAIRAGYLDELDFDLQGALNTIAGYIDAEIAAIITSQGRQLFTMDFWSLPQEEVAVTIAAGDKALPSVTVADLPGGATIVRAIAMFKFRMVENHTYAGVNSLDGAQEIQVAVSVDAINFVNGQFTLAQDTREGGDVVIGVIDIAGTVNANGAYAFHWDLAKAVQTGINFNDIQMGIRIWYSV